jgi:hypothetical protein
MALLLKVAGQGLAHLAAAAGQDDTHGARIHGSDHVHRFSLRLWIPL